jgi:hypothetical protein
MVVLLLCHPRCLRRKRASRIQSAARLVPNVGLPSHDDALAAASSLLLSVRVHRKHFTDFVLTRVATMVRACLGDADWEKNCHRLLLLLAATEADPQLAAALYDVIMSRDGDTFFAWLCRYWASTEAVRTVAAVAGGAVGDAGS